MCFGGIGRHFGLVGLKDGNGMNAHAFSCSWFGMSFLLLLAAWAVSQVHMYKYSAVCCIVLAMVA